MSSWSSFFLVGLVAHPKSKLILAIARTGNTVVNASLPIFLDSVVCPSSWLCAVQTPADLEEQVGGGWIAVLGSTFLIVSCSLLRQVDNAIAD